MKTLVSSIQKIIEITILGILCIAVLTIVTSKTQVLGGIQSMVVLSGSMEPSISTGSIVFVQKDGWYFPGDVLTYQKTKDISITHRLIEKVQTADGEQYRLQGDANESPDSELVRPRDVKGKVIFFLPWIGWFSQFLKSTVGFALLIVIPGSLLLCHELWIIKKEIEYETERKILSRLQLQ